MTTNNDDERQLDPDSTATRREAMAAGMALGMPAWLDWGDESDSVGDLGIFDTHYVADSGEKLTIDPEVLDFVGALNVTETDDGVEIALDNEALDIDGLTNPLTDNLDANGWNISNVSSFDTEKASITKRPTPSCDFTIFKEAGDYYATDRAGSIVAGGDGNKNVSDATDFGEVFAWVVNNNSQPAIRLPPGNYTCKTQQTLTEQFALWGAGRNRTFVVAGDSLQGKKVFLYESGGAITRIDSIKFTAFTDNLPDTYFEITNATDPPKELIVSYCEFRDAQSWGINYDAANGTMAFNEFKNCWFLTGAGLRLVGLDDVTFVGNHIQNSQTDMVFDTIDQLSTAGNVYANGATPNTYNTVGWNTLDQTIVKAYPTSDVSISGGSWADVPLETSPSDARDARGEVDTANNVFTPDSTGWYQVSVQATFQTLNDGDQLMTRFRNVSDGNNVLRTLGEAGGASTNTRSTSSLLQLAEGKDYKLQVLNVDANDTITSGQEYTFVSISDEFRF